MRLMLSSAPVPFLRVILYSQLSGVLLTRKTEVWVIYPANKGYRAISVTYFPSALANILENSQKLATN